jgi:hypothetical protein
VRFVDSLLSGYFSFSFDLYLSGLSSNPFAPFLFSHLKVSLVNWTFLSMMSTTAQTGVSLFPESWFADSLTIRFSLLASYRCFFI